MAVKVNRQSRRTCIAIVSFVLEKELGPCDGITLDCLREKKEGGMRFSLLAKLSISHKSGTIHTILMSAIF